MLSKREMLKKLGNSIKKHRKLKGLTKYQLADASCLSVKTLHEIESGLYDLCLLSLLTIKEALDVSTDELFDFE